MNDEVFYLSQMDKASPTWVRLLGYLNAELAAKRAKLEGEMPEAKTNALRAQIGVLKGLIALDTKAPEPN